MDLATIVITASAIIIILQTVLIVLFVTSRRIVPKPEAPGVAPVTGDNRDFRKRRDENRFNRRPPVDQRQKPVPAPAAAPSAQPVDHMEKSLRDINLRLKNAERDQENARKKIRDVIQTPQNPQRRFDQSAGRPNRGRDDDFRRRDRERDRNNRPQFRDRDQNRSSEIERSPSEQPISPAVQPASGPVPERVSPEPRPPSTVVSQPPAAKEPVAIVPENTEILHGRKVLVRRRILTAEEQAQAAKAAPGGAGSVAGQSVIGAVAAQAPQTESGLETPAEEHAAPSESSAGDGEPQNIHFGR
jgi:hypothetical protein